MNNFINEVWVDLPVDKEPFKNIIANRYKISSYGNIMDVVSCRAVTKYNKVGTSQIMVNLRDYNKISQGFRVGLLVLLCFDYREDYKNLYCYFIDGNINNLKLENLCWSDGKKFNKNIMMIDKQPLQLLYPNEKWLHIPSIAFLKDFYIDNRFVSNYGRIADINNYGELKESKLTLLNSGYYSITLKRKIDDVPVSVLVHRIVAIVFNYNENYNSLVINHIDGNPLNNYIDNLEWVPQKQNVAHAFNTELNTRYGSNGPGAKIPIEIIYEIYDLYLLGYKKFQIHDIINNKYSINIDKDYVRTLINGDVRCFDLSDYLQSHGYQCSKLFTKQQIELILNSAKDNTLYKKFMIDIKFKLTLIVDNSPYYLAASLIFRIVDRQITYHDYILS